MEWLLNYNLPPKIQLIVNVFLLWIGFATVVGFVARLFVPSKMTRNPYIVFLVGLTGGCLGPLIFSEYYPQENFNPISLIGFLSAIVAAVLCLVLFYFILFFSRIVPLSKSNKDDDATNSKD